MEDFALVLEFCTGLLLLVAAGGVLAATSQVRGRRLAGASVSVFLLISIFDMVTESSFGFGSMADIAMDVAHVVIVGVMACTLVGVARRVRQAHVQMVSAASEYERAQVDYEALMLHRIQNPLTVVRGSATTLLDHSESLDPPMARQLLLNIVSAADILEHARVEPDPMTPEEMVLNPVPDVVPRSEG